MSGGNEKRKSGCEGNKIEKEKLKIKDGEKRGKEGTNLITLKSLMQEMGISSIQFQCNTDLP